jgi:molybdopterin molybdotransferase
MTEMSPTDTLSSCDTPDTAVLSTDEARQRILDAVSALGADAAETLPLIQALDRVLAANIISAINVPPHRNSAMDGYALAASALPATGETQNLKVVGASFAGHPFNRSCNSGECIQIMTGAVMPDDLDTVIPVEQVQIVDANTIRINSKARPGDNVRPLGEDIQQGQSVLQRGKRITAADLGLIASLGIEEVLVIRKLRVAFFTTGDELRSLGEDLQPGQIYDSNRYTLYAMLAHQHCQITDLGIVGDNPQALQEALTTAAIDHDVIISTGGVSVGEADHVRKVFGKLGNINFWKVALKPGRPLVFGQLQQAWFFGLPGNPVAVMVGFRQFVYPALQRLSGEAPKPTITLQAVSSSVLKKRPGRTEFQRGILSQAADGGLTVCKTGAQGSGILSSMSQANCFIILPAEQTLVEAGAMVMVQPFADWL